MGIGKELYTLYDEVGYTFKEIKYLECALTHSSYSNEMRTKGYRANSNEALEFLGDAVLQLVISEELYKKYEKQGEGALTKMRQFLVCESTLARLARGLSLGDYLNVGNGEELAGVRNQTKVLADAFEALVAAIYLDDKNNGGANYADIIISLFSKEISDVSKNSGGDYKTKLQQFIEKNGDSVLRYDFYEEGPEHHKMFNVKAYINNNLVGEGTGSTKRQAEMNAAKCALELFGILGG